MIGDISIPSPAFHARENTSKFLEQLRHRASHCEQRIILSDGEDPRILEAVSHLQLTSRLEFLLIGRTQVILSQAKQLGITKKLEIYDPLCHPLQDWLTHLLRAQFEKRGKPVPDTEKLKSMALDPVYAGVLLLKAGLAHGMVGGAATPTAKVIRAGLQVVGVNSENPVVSGAFVMLLPDKLPAGQTALVLADAAVIPLPSTEQLASITINTAQVARAILGQEPVVALLSFSTYGSAEDPSAAKMVEALQLVRQRSPNLCVDGEMQLDAALIPEISASKAPGNLVKGQANVLIFPNLDAGNIAYKLVERVARATALGVILSGLAMPINDLSRGCSVEDVMNMICVTALQADSGEKQLLNA